MAIIIPDTKVTRSTVYKEAGDARYEEAKYLADAHPSGAIYLAGYLVECYLKWAICERNSVRYLQDLSDRELADTLTSERGHNLEMLCRVSRYDRHFETDHFLRRAFQIVASWSPNVRYIRKCGGRREAAQFLAAVRILRADISAWAYD